MHRIGRPLILSRVQSVTFCTCFKNTINQISIFTPWNQYQRARRTNQYNEHSKCCLKSISSGFHGWFTENGLKISLKISTNSVYYSRCTVSEFLNSEFNQPMSIWLSIDRPRVTRSLRSGSWTPGHHEIYKIVRIIFAKNRIFKFEMPISRITISYPVAYFLNQWISISRF